MKNAYLVIAHSDPEMLYLLTDKLGVDNDIFIHIDKKSCLDSYSDTLNKCNVYLVKERISVSWAGFSMVKAMLSLLSTAMSKHAYSHYIFLSGKDYPIKKQGEIDNYFRENKDKELIRAFSITRCPCPHCHRKVDRYFFLRIYLVIPLLIGYIKYLQTCFFI